MKNSLLWCYQTKEDHNAKHCNVGSSCKKKLLQGYLVATLLEVNCCSCRYMMRTKRKRFQTAKQIKKSMEDGGDAGDGAIEKNSVGQWFVMTFVQSTMK